MQEERVKKSFKACNGIKFSSFVTEVKVRINNFDTEKRISSPITTKSGDTYLISEIQIYGDNVLFWCYNGLRTIPYIPDELSR